MVLDVLDLQHFHCDESINRLCLTPSTYDRPYLIYRKAREFRQEPYVQASLDGILNFILPFAEDLTLPQSTGGHGNSRAARFQQIPLHKYMTQPIQ